MIVCFIAICKSQMILSDSVTMVILQLGFECKAAIQSRTALYYLQPKLLESMVVCALCVVRIVVWIVAM